MSNQNYPAPMYQPVPAFQDVAEIRKPNIVRGTAYAARVPKLPFQYFLDPSGNLVRLVVASTRNTQGAIEAGGDPLRAVKFNQARAIKDGFIPWEYADVSSLAPWFVNTATGRMDRATWESWREEELKRRRDAYNAKATEHNAQYQASEAKQAESFVNALDKAVEKRFGGDPVKSDKNPFRRGKGEPAE